MRKFNIWFRKTFYKKLSREDILAYRNILKLVYHKNASEPILDVTKKQTRYFIRNPKIGFDLIIDHTMAEIVNDNICPIRVNENVYERAIDVIKKKKCLQIEKMESEIKGRKSDIMLGVYKKIK